VGVEEQHVVEDVGAAAGAGAAMSPIGAHPGVTAAGHPDELHGGRGYVPPPTAASTVIAPGMPGGSPYFIPGVVTRRCRAYSIVPRPWPRHSSPQQGTTRNPEEHAMSDFKSHHNSDHHNDNHHSEHHSSEHHSEYWEEHHSSYDSYDSYDWNDKHNNDWDDKSGNDCHEQHEDNSSHDYSHQSVHH
jgi:hypothetical protein